ncbi:fumarylacetoacetate hydrolase family protein [Plebeiibacterium sediminum]|uniref:Fumarylacetoacetate hydrolase family protein n=1 Tax=Plebeiibacterium sediminum TaxID=2992112 RepID=A0AAE3M7U2_9BACT|nr:fumarylacetoacetate hydrolase family protein [Plebeiobacterium sediminum]MCW3788602.1 fumarylacetoacetate hydrolase family protein [Plebeiobacterium sediminum]
MKIICIGRNYAKHAKELENEVPDEPVIFLKPDTALLRNNQPFFVPEFAEDFHYETELVIKIDRLGKNIGKEFAHRYYNEIGMGIDFTARDLQQKLKDKGLPWERAKAFDSSAAISKKFVPKTRFKDIQNVNFKLLVNGEERQIGYTGDMLFKVDEIIAYVSKFFTLKIGDLIYTGTPAGVGSVNIGDHFEVFLENEKMMDFLIK